jgi:hypothetical protein
MFCQNCLFFLFCICLSRPPSDCHLANHASRDITSRGARCTSAMVQSLSNWECGITPFDLGDIAIFSLSGVFGISHLIWVQLVQLGMRNNPVRLGGHSNIFLEWFSWHLPSNLGSTHDDCHPTNLASREIKSRGARCTSVLAEENHVKIMRNNPVRFGGGTSLRQPLFVF